MEIAGRYPAILFLTTRPGSGDGLRFRLLCCGWNGGSVMSDIYLENLWRDMCGLPEKSTKTMDINDLKRTEWSPEFERYMKNRLIIGAFRYGLLSEPDKPNWDRLKRIEEEVKLYQEDGNDERLIDIANMCLLEFTEGKHPKKHFKASDDGNHTEVSR
jgi:hypothetical protein